MRNLVLSVLCIAVLSACGSSMKVTDFQDANGDLLIEQYFEGETKAWGFFEDRFGNIRREFAVDITGTWDGETLTLDERFLYSDGERETRLWKIKKTGERTYEGTEANAIGIAKGESAGNAFTWKYDYNLKVGDAIWKVRFDDWMFLQSDGVLLNKATVTRWGIKIGTVFLSFQKLGEQNAARNDARDRRPTALKLVPSQPNSLQVAIRGRVGSLAVIN